MKSDLAIQGRRHRQAVSDRCTSKGATARFARIADGYLASLRLATASRRIEAFRRTAGTEHVLGVEGCFVRGQAGRGRRRRRLQRCRQEHAVESALADHRSHRQVTSICAVASAHCWKSAQDSIRSSPVAKISFSTVRSWGCLARHVKRQFDEIVDFAGVEKFHRHTGQTILQRHVPAFGLCRRRSSGTRNLAGR